MCLTLRKPAGPDPTTDQEGPTTVTMGTRSPWSGSWSARPQTRPRHFAPHGVPLRRRGPHGGRGGRRSGARQDDRCGSAGPELLLRKTGFQHVSAQPDHEDPGRGCALTRARRLRTIRAPVRNGCAAPPSTAAQSVVRTDCAAGFGPSFNAGRGHGRSPDHRRGRASLRFGVAEKGVVDRGSRNTERSGERSAGRSQGGLLREVLPLRGPVPGLLRGPRRRFAGRRAGRIRAGGALLPTHCSSKSWFGKVRRTGQGRRWGRWRTRGLVTQLDVSTCAFSRSASGRARRWDAGPSPTTRPCRLPPVGDLVRRPTAGYAKTPADVAGARVEARRSDPSPPFKVRSDPSAYRRFGSPPPQGRRPRVARIRTRCRQRGQLRALAYVTEQTNAGLNHVPDGWLGRPCPRPGQLGAHVAGS
ncbi:hypothetical protein ABIE67_000052 [Streptomyces sp. V4I8]